MTSSQCLFGIAIIFGAPVVVLLLIDWLWPAEQQHATIIDGPWDLEERQGA